MNEGRWFGGTRMRLSLLLGLAGVAALVAVLALGSSCPASRAQQRGPGQTLLIAGFERGLQGWNTSGLGEVLPTVTSATAREGQHSARVRLTGHDARSELVLGGDGDDSVYDAIEFHEGDEAWYGFSFLIRKMVYGHPGAHNLIMQFKSDGTGGPNFGLQLWDYYGKKGLWTGGPSQLGRSGERFLAPVSERRWHDVQIHFRASSHGDGFYAVYLDGSLVDERDRISMIVPGHDSAYIKTGLYRNGETIPGTSELLIDAARLGTSQSAVLPR